MPSSLADVPSALSLANNPLHNTLLPLLAPFFADLHSSRNSLQWQNIQKVNVFPKGFLELTSEELQVLGHCTDLLKSNLFRSNVIVPLQGMGIFTFTARRTGKN